ncbi:OpgC domain-containing protein [Paracoccaceae bacterium Fryx2]|nr:OpgC domain-containing protein [Paracoccaceae bacterium Fryx2]
MPLPIGRDPRLDLFRGLALVLIFINHVPGTIYESVTTRNFGFSDAAEAFVLMSGLAAALAYGPDFQAGAVARGVRRLWGRAWTLYLVHLMTTVCAIGIAAGAALWFGATQLLGENQLGVLFEQPLGFLVGIPLLTHQLGYANILPMYAVLLLATPLMLLLGQRAPRLLLALSVALWAFSGQFRLDLPNYPTPGGWFFNPLAWQLIFVVGLLTGLAMRAGRRLVPVSRGLQVLALGWLVLSFFWVWVPGLAAPLNHAMWVGAQHGVPFSLHSFDKTYLGAPRLLHILALAYLVTCVPGLRQAAAGWLARPLVLLGRHSLPVFALGTVLCFLMQAIKDVAPPGLGLDTALIFGGLGLQLALAFVQEHWRDNRPPARAATPAAVAATPQAA